MSGRLERLALAASLAVAAAAAAAAAIRAYDFGWHLRAGEWILAHGRPPRVDFMTFTAAGRAWVDHEWLFQALLAGVVGLGGLTAAWLLKPLAVVAAAVLPALALRRRGHHVLAVAALAAAALAGARFRFFVRPELAGLVLAPLFLTLLMQARDRARGGGRTWPWLLPLPFLCVAWANMHPSALLGAGLVLLWALAVLAEERRRQPALPFLAAAAGCVLALLVNPYGADLLRVPLSIRAALAGAAVSNPEWGATWQAAFWPFWVLLPALAGAAVWLRRRGCTASPPMLACALALTVLAAASLRFLGFFYICLPLLALGSWAPPGRAGEGRDEDRRRNGIMAAAGALLLLLAAGWFLARPSGAELGPGLAAGRFPAAMAATYRRLAPSGALYHPVRFGGYLAWQLAPAEVFIDGRNELHAELLDEMARYRLAGDLHGWDAMLQRYGVESAILAYDEDLLDVRLPDGTFVRRAPRSVYFRRADWVLVDWDDVAMLLVRRRHLPAPAEGMQEDLTFPDDLELTDRRLRDGRLAAEHVLAVARRRLADHPPGARARLMEELALRQLERDGTAPGRPRSAEPAAARPAGSASDG